jgi:hypothetical protein
MDSGRNPRSLPSIDEDILGNDNFAREERTQIYDESSHRSMDDVDADYFKKVFDDFVAMKRKCGEKTDSLTYEKFVIKLRNNRDALLAKHNCRTVKFQVYVKDGRAALKASPVR